MTDEPLPPAVTQAMNFAGAVVRHVAGGSVNVSPQIVDRRLAICSRCPHKRMDNRCSQCGCHLASKAKWSRERCPDGHWGRAEWPGIKLMRRGTIGKGYHRSGWPYAMSALKPLVAPRAGILFDDFVEQTWFYGRRREPLVEPWVGILHHPPNPPAWAHPWEHVERLLDLQPFRASLERCRLIITLSHHLADWVREHLDVPVAVVRHPTATDAPGWDFAAWERNSRRVLQLGWYLRNTRAIHQVYAPGYRRVRILPDKPVVRTFDDACRRNIERPEFEGVVERGYVRNAEYDSLMASSVVLTELLDASANNVLVECLARNTPVLVNRNPAAVEYLGERYPLYFDDIRDVTGLLQPERVHAAAKYLKARPKDSLGGDHFKTRVASAVQTYAGAA